MDDKQPAPETKTPAELIAEMRAEIEALKTSHAEELKQRDAVIAELSRAPAEPAPVIDTADSAAQIAERINKRR